MRPMSEALTDRTPVLAKLRSDLVEHTGRGDLELLAGIWVVVRHEGFFSDGRSIGWGLAGPFGYGGLPDQWFDGFVPLPDDDRYGKV